MASDTNPAATRLQGRIHPVVQQDWLDRAAPPGFINLGVLQEIRPVIRELGEDPDRIIVEAGIDPRIFRSPKNLVPFTAIGNIISLAAERTGCPHLGILVGSRASLGSLHLLGALMGSSGTLRQALHSLERHLCLQNRGAVVRLTAEDDLAVLSYSPYQPGARGAALHSEGALAVTVKIIRELLAEDWAPAEVMLPRARPADIEPYRRFFRAPLRFDQEMAALVFPAAALAVPLRTAAPVLYRELEEKILRLEEDSPHAFTDDLRRLLRTELVRDRCGARDVARRLAMHRRTLNRRLQPEGRSFKIVVSEIRYEIARQLLRDTTISLAQIAAALDFSEAAAFTRAFRRWSGQTPSAWRAASKRDLGRPSSKPRRPRSGRDARTAVGVPT